MHVNVTCDKLNLTYLLSGVTFWMVWALSATGSRGGFDCLTRKLAFTDFSRVLREHAILVFHFFGSFSFLTLSMGPQLHSLLDWCYLLARGSFQSRFLLPKLCNLELVLITLLFFWRFALSHAVCHQLILLLFFASLQFSVLDLFLCSLGEGVFGLKVWARVSAL